MKKISSLYIIDHDLGSMDGDLRILGRGNDGVLRCALYEESMDIPEATIVATGLRPPPYHLRYDRPITGLIILDRAPPAAYHLGYILPFWQPITPWAAIRVVYALARRLLRCHLDRGGLHAYPDWAADIGPLCYATIEDYLFPTKDDLIIRSPGEKTAAHIDLMGLIRHPRYGLTPM